MGLETVVGLGLTSFLFLYFAFSLAKDEEGNDSHFLLKLLLVFFALVTLLLMPKALIDGCQTVVANQTVSGAVTTYNYVKDCPGTASQTDVSFLRVIYGFFILFGMYFLVYLFNHWRQESDRFLRRIGKR